VGADELLYAGSQAQYDALLLGGDSSMQVCQATGQDFCVLPNVAVAKSLGPGVVIRSCIRACAAFRELDGAACAGLSSGSLKLRLHSCNSAASSVSASASPLLVTHHQEAAATPLA
jgi:hypothetical protein